MANTKGMVFLDPGHKVIEDMLTERLAPDARRPMEPVTATLVDFDDVQYRVYVSPEQPDIFQLSVSMKSLADLRRYGGQLVLDDLYRGMVCSSPAPGYDLTLQFNVRELPDTPANLIKKLSQLKRNLFGAPFTQCFSALSKGVSGKLPPIQIRFRQHETVYIVPQADRVIIVFSVDFQDKADQTLARVFLQEFVEARRHVNNAPPVSFSKDPPHELRGLSGLSNSPYLVGYVSFAVFPSHVEGQKQNNAVNMIIGFRNYLHYHIKTAKSYLHTRMRNRVNLMLQVLNRAIPEKESKEKKTVTGKTFRRAT